MANPTAGGTNDASLAPSDAPPAAPPASRPIVAAHPASAQSAFAASSSKGPTGRQSGKSTKSAINIGSSSSDSEPASSSAAPLPPLHFTKVPPPVKGTASTKDKASASLFSRALHLAAGGGDSDTSSSASASSVPDVRYGQQLPHFDQRSLNSAKETLGWGAVGRGEPKSKQPIGKLAASSDPDYDTSPKRNASRKRPPPSSDGNSSSPDGEDSDISSSDFALEKTTALSSDTDSDTSLLRSPFAPKVPAKSSSNASENAPKPNPALTKAVAAFSASSRKRPPPPSDGGGSSADGFEESSPKPNPASMKATASSLPRAPPATKAAKSSSATSAATGPVASFLPTREPVTFSSAKRCPDLECQRGSCLLMHLCFARMCSHNNGGKGTWLASDQFKRSKSKEQKRFKTCVSYSEAHRVYAPDNNKKSNPIHNPINNPINNPLRACRHIGNKYNCVECVPFKVAQKQGWICNICGTARTRSGVCRSCFQTALGHATLRIESVVRGGLQHIIPGIGECTGNRRGGSGCQDQIGGNDCSGDDAPATRSALPDLELLLSRPLRKPSATKTVQANQIRIIIEVDEKRHLAYEVSCELGRYDILMYGVGAKLDEVPPTLVIRFNPHPLPGQVLPELEDRIREVAQVIRDEMKSFEECPKDNWESPTLTVQYMFYGDSSVHLETAKRASATFSIKKHINDIREGSLDDDIAKFKLGDLKEEVLAEGIRDRVQNILQVQASEKCCTAIRDYGKRCGGYRKKGSDLCWPHWKRAEKAAEDKEAAEATPPAEKRK